MKRRLLYILLLLVALPFGAMATHNRAGEITFRQLGQLTYEVTITTYTDTRSSQADRAQILEFEWGDGTTINITRSNGNGEVVGPPNAYIKKNLYIATHTYRGPGNYILRFRDPNRIDAIQNITNSVDVPFYVESLLKIDPTRGGLNNSPTLLQMPVDFACVGKIFTHNPNAYDIDGDSLTFTLIPPKRDVDMDVPGYFRPPASNGFTLDFSTGQLVWDAPQREGIYNIAILIEEYRNGSQIGYITRDMQIIVKACNNRPPEIQPIADTCVVAGQPFVLRQTIIATDPDTGQMVTLSATGGPFVVGEKKAQMRPSPAVGNTTVSAEFEWEIACSHIRKQPYQVVFKAEDNGTPTALADLQPWNIRVIGPPPLFPQVSALGSNVNLTWQKPLCQPVGYLIYRRIDSSFWAPGHCETGIPPSQGFRLIDTIASPDILTYTDAGAGSGLSPGLVYCYRITALYINKDQYEIAEGIASDEVCVELKKDIPVITHVSVLETSPAQGTIYTAWSSPTELDTVQTPGPYLYDVSRKNVTTGGSYTLLTTYTSPTLSGLIDTTFIDSSLNTTSNQYAYKIEFFYTLNGEKTLMGQTVEATSIFLKANRWHEKIELFWEVSVPWFNDTFVVYRRDTVTGLWDSIGATFGTRYMDTGLVNGKEMCYYVKSIGSYQTSGFTNPLINLSQELCTSPRDTIPPCPPQLTSAETECDKFQTGITWLAKNDACDADVIGYRIYYSRRRENDFKLIDSVAGFDRRSFTDTRFELQENLAGCYALTSVDSFGNESELSNRICVDNCPEYDLPNVITPNNDEYNDLFMPMPGWRFVDSIDLQVYNRWGQLVYQTKDPRIRWDGVDQESGNKLPQSAYYYVCIVYETYLDGVKARTLKGVVHILY